MLGNILSFLVAPRQVRCQGVPYRPNQDFDSKSNDIGQVVAAIKDIALQLC